MFDLDGVIKTGSITANIQQASVGSFLGRTVINQSYMIIPLAIIIVSIAAVILYKLYCACHTNSEPSKQVPINSREKLDHQKEVKVDDKNNQNKFKSDQSPENPSVSSTIESNVVESPDLFDRLTFSDKPAQCPLKKEIIQSKNPSSLCLFSEKEKSMLKSLTTMEGILNKPISELPLFPLVMDGVDNLRKLQISSYMNTIEEPISLGYCQDGWPFIVVRVYDGKDPSIARSIYLYTGPQGNHVSDWEGWNQGIAGSSCPMFFRDWCFIDDKGDEIAVVKDSLILLKNLMKNKRGEDSNGKMWLLERP